MSEPSAALASEMPVLNGAPAIELKPQDRDDHRGRNAVFSILLSLAVIVAVIHEMGGVNIPRLAGMVPASPAFWITFTAYYMISPASEWFIFRKLWQIPPAGFLALLRKKVYNDLLLGYLGEAYFYTWARRRVSLEAAPFGAVKDVAILSAITGNAVTMGLLFVAFPMLGATQLGLDSRTLTLSLGVILAISLFAMVFRRRVFSLARGELIMITQVHLARIILSAVLLAILWHLVLPQVPLSWWLYLSTLRLLVSRLPLMPNKDLLFAGIAVLVLGHEHDIGVLMTLMAGLILATHLVLGGAIAVNDLANPEKRG
ncbi:hypothetical protein [Novosphingobium album (ex Hu et al. 2023)]|uniref:Flippase-like domain-containing protein n=1 Tax=Novosphingobium album (ex Hu et al. 2023) TaxID=2930093 RepID=A0ABT0AY89_9SPHN|nr:hypothetical protein [Novosphingobium album (ex Hu et al. 2023)]MCJ2177775.1 hypothetical protein [Novosphingobium album (ex Hu et al. 2023)]